jgi:hypothetical protein
VQSQFAHLAGIAHEHEVAILFDLFFFLFFSVFRFSIAFLRHEGMFTKVIVLGAPF